MFNLLALPSAELSASAAVLLHFFFQVLVETEDEAVILFRGGLSSFAASRFSNSSNWKRFSLTVRFTPEEITIARASD